MFEELDKEGYPDFLDDNCIHCKRAWALYNRYGENRVSEHIYTPNVGVRALVSHLQTDHCTCKEDEEGSEA